VLDSGHAQGLPPHTHLNSGLLLTVSAPRNPACASESTASLMAASSRCTAASPGDASATICTTRHDVPAGRAAGTQGALRSKVAERIAEILGCKLCCPVMLLLIPISLQAATGSAAGSTYTSTKRRRPSSQPACRPEPSVGCCRQHTHALGGSEPSCSPSQGPEPASRCAQAGRLRGREHAGS
jgi:hypothetical protein